MIKNIYGHKITANEMAKWLVYDKGMNAEYWAEWESDGMTEREIEEVSKCVNRQLERVRGFLNIDKINTK